MKYLKILAVLMLLAITSLPALAGPGDLVLLQKTGTSAITVFPSTSGTSTTVTWMPYSILASSGSNGFVVTSTVPLGNGVTITSGTLATPESFVTAAPGCLYVSTTGTSGTSAMLYMKTTGTAATGWVAK